MFFYTKNHSCQATPIHDVTLLKPSLVGGVSEQAWPHTPSSRRFRKGLTKPCPGPRVDVLTAGLAVVSCRTSICPRPAILLGLGRPESRGVPGSGLHHHWTEVKAERPVVDGRDVGDVLRRGCLVDGLRRRTVLRHGGVGAASSPVETHVHILVWNHPGGAGDPPEQLLGGRTVPRLRLSQ